MVEERKKGKKKEKATTRQQTGQNIENEYHPPKPPVDIRKVWPRELNPSRPELTFTSPTKNEEKKKQRERERIGLLRDIIRKRKSDSPPVNGAKRRED